MRHVDQSDHLSSPEFDLPSARIFALQVVQTHALAAVLAASENPDYPVGKLRTVTDKVISKARSQIRAEATRFVGLTLEGAFKGAIQKFH